MGPLAAAAADSGGFWLLRAPILLCLYGDLSHTRRAPRGKSQPAIGSGWTRMRRSCLRPGRLKVKASCAAGRGSGVIDSDSESRHPDIRVRGLASVGSWITCDVTRLTSRTTKSKINQLYLVTLVFNSYQHIARIAKAVQHQCHCYSHRASSLGMSHPPIGDPHGETEGNAPYLEKTDTKTC